MPAALLQSDPETVAAAIKRWAPDPVLFAREALGVTLWWRQEEFLRALLSHTKIAVQSGQKTGKTTGAAVAAIWWALLRNRGAVRILGPSEDQLKQVLWAEIRRLIADAPIKLGPDPAVEPTTGWKLPATHGSIECVIAARDKPEAAAGRSGANQLYLVDEASGLDDQFFKAAAGNLIGGGSMLALSNPTRTSGEYFEICSGRAGWHVIRIDSRETPNYTGVGTPIPGLATRAGVQSIIDEYGEESPEFDVRVRGVFPQQGSDVVFPLRLLDEATERHAETAVASGELMLGVDVARYGDDDSVIYARRGKRVVGRRSIHGLDSFQLAAAIADELAEHQLSPHEGATINIDATGGLGSGPADVLRQAQEGRIAGVSVGRNCTIVEVNFGASANDSESYVNVRSELAFECAAWLKAGGTLPDVPELRRQLAAFRYQFDRKGSGRRSISSKDELRKLLKRSPDDADALFLACYGAIDAAKPAEPSRYESLLSARGAEMAGDSRY